MDTCFTLRPIARLQKADIKNQALGSMLQFGEVKTVRPLLLLHTQNEENHVPYTNIYMSVSDACMQLL